MGVQEEVSGPQGAQGGAGVQEWVKRQQRGVQGTQKGYGTQESYKRGCRRHEGPHGWKGGT